MKIPKYVQRVLDKLEELEDKHPKAFEELVLLSRSESVHLLGEQAVRRLVRLGYILYADMDEGDLQVDGEKLEILRIYLGETPGEIEAALKRLSLDYPYLLITLNNAVSNQGSITPQQGRIMEFYHLVFKHGNGYHPHILLHEMIESISQATDDALRVIGVES